MGRLAGLTILACGSFRNKDEKFAGNAPRGDQPSCLAQGGFFFARSRRLNDSRGQLIPLAR